MLCLSSFNPTYETIKVSSIRQGEQSYQRLQILGLKPGLSFFIQNVQFTKQKGFGTFNLAGYYPRKYRGKVESSGWY